MCSLSLPHENGMPYLFNFLTCVNKAVIICGQPLCGEKCARPKLTRLFSRININLFCTLLIAYFDYSIRECKGNR